MKSEVFARKSPVVAVPRFDSRDGHRPTGAGITRLVTVATYRQPSDMTANDSQTDDPKRIDTDLDLANVNIGDRIDPALIPRSPKIDVGKPVAQHLAKHNPPENQDDRTFSVRLVAHGYRDQYQDVQAALVYDAEADLFARISGHTNSGAMNQAERDYKVRDVGRTVEIVDQWDVDIPDLEAFGETEAEFVAEWIDILFGNIRHGDDPGEEIAAFDGKKFTLRDADGRTARVQYQLVTRD